MCPTLWFMTKHLQNYRHSHQPQLDSELTDDIMLCINTASFPMYTSFEKTKHFHSGNWSHVTCWHHAVIWSLLSLQSHFQICQKSFSHFVRMPNVFLSLALCEQPADRQTRQSYRRHPCSSFNMWCGARRWRRSLYFCKSTNTTLWKCSVTSKSPKYKYKEISKIKVLRVSKVKVFIMQQNGPCHCCCIINCIIWVLLL